MTSRQRSDASQLEQFRNDALTFVAPDDYELSLPAARRLLKLLIHATVPDNNAEAS